MAIINMLNYFFFVMSISKKSNAKVCFFCLLILMFCLSSLSADDLINYWPGRLTVCFSADLVGNTVGDFEISYSSDNTVITPWKWFNKLSQEYEIIKLEQKYWVKDQSWHLDGKYPMNIFRLVINEPSRADDLLSILQSNKYLLFAGHEGVVISTLTPNDDFYVEQWALEAIHAFDAWDIENGSQDIIIGVVDSGIKWNHPDLQANMWINEAELPDISINWTTGVITGGDGRDNDGNGKIDDVMGWDFNSTSNGGTDNNPFQNKRGNNHGTHVAGCAAAVGDNGGVIGPAFNVSILASKHTPFDYHNPGWGGGGYENTNQGIYYLSDTGAHVINCSYGEYSYNNADAIAEDANLAVSYAKRRGSLVIASAGNNNLDSTVGYFYPGCAIDAFRVAATDQDDLKWTEPNMGSNYGTNIKISAPGVSILSTLFNTNGANTYDNKTGTSMAAPIVSGVAALIKSFYPSITVDQLAISLQMGADPIDHLNHPSYAGKLGAGRVNALNSLNYAKGFILKAQWVNGPLSGIVNQSNNYTVSITNDGKCSISDYTVRLFDGDTVLSSIQGIPLEPGQSHTFTLSWSPSAAGFFRVRGQVSINTVTSPPHSYTTNTLSVNILTLAINIYVTQDVTMVNNITFFATIQEAINACRPNKTVMILKGSNPYTGHGNIDITWPSDKNITVTGQGRNSNMPIIDCEGNIGGFHFNNISEQNKLMNLKIQGTVTAVTLYKSNPQLIGLVLSNNVVGIWVNNDNTIVNDVQVLDCEFIENNNTANNFAKGTAVSAITRSLTIKDSKFIGNNAIDAYGASLYFKGCQLQLENNYFERNCGQQEGANINIEHTGYRQDETIVYSFVTISGNRFIGNESVRGSGMPIRPSTNITFGNVGYFHDILLERNIFHSNGNQISFPSVFFDSYCDNVNITNSIKYINNTAFGNYGSDYGNFELVFNLSEVSTRLPIIEIKNSIIEAEIFWYSITSSPHINNVSIKNAYINFWSLHQGMQTSDLFDSETQNIRSIVDLSTSNSTYQPNWTNIVKSPAIDSGDPDTNGNGVPWFLDIDDEDWDGTRKDIGAVPAMAHGGIAHTIYERQSRNSKLTRDQQTAWVCFPYIDGLYTEEVTIDNNSYNVKDLVYNLHHYHNNDLFSSDTEVSWNFHEGEYTIRQVGGAPSDPQHNLDSRYGYKITKIYDTTNPPPPLGAKIVIETAGFRKGLIHNLGVDIPILGVPLGDPSREILVGYFKTSSEKPLIALQDIKNRLLEIKTKNWSMSRDSVSGSWEPNNTDYRFNFGEAVSLRYIGTANATFQWGGSGIHEPEYTHPATRYFEFIEESDYLPIYVTIPDEMFCEEGGELGIFIDNECFGAEVIISNLVPIKAYILESDVDFSTADVDFRLHKYENRAPEQKFSNYQVFDQSSQTFKTQKLDLSQAQRFYRVSLKSEEILKEETLIITSLIGNYPNPFNPSTLISFSLAQPVNVELSIYNIRGQLVKTLINDWQETGVHTIEWNGADNAAQRVSSGVYFYKLQAGSIVETKKMLLIK